MSRFVSFFANWVTFTCCTQSEISSNEMVWPDTLWNTTLFFSPVSVIVNWNWFSREVTKRRTYPNMIFQSRRSRALRSIYHFSLRYSADMAPLFLRNISFLTRGWKWIPNTDSISFLVEILRLRPHFDLLYFGIRCANSGYSFLHRFSAAAKSGILETGWSAI